MTTDTENPGIQDGSVQKDIDRQIQLHHKCLGPGMTLRLIPSSLHPNHTLFLTLTAGPIATQTSEASRDRQ